ncbi:MAG TPA: hypothetical protein VEA16_22005, partial [Vicinamibacterales bacterium]|nr:hypothetical protein [Vicinamibacterales bacterium]
MLGEQTRDWTLALGGAGDLPLLGAPSTSGGRGLGPAYYWLLWLGRVTIGPFMDNLPHAGGVVVALLQSSGDVWLFLALSRRVPWGLALAGCLLLASGPFDIAISSVIWNPPVAEALIKMAIASAMTIGHTPLAAAAHGSLALTAALGWMAVQAHLSAIFVAAPLLLGVVLQPLLHQRRRVFEHDTTSGQRRLAWQESARAVAIVTLAIVLLQIPFLISLATAPETPAGPSTAIAAIAGGRTFEPMRGLDIVAGVTGNIVKPMPDEFKFWIPTLVAAAIVLIVFRRDAIVLGASLGAVATASLVFARWTGSYDRYWFLTMAPSMTLLFTMAFAAVPLKPLVRLAGIALALWVASWQPARIIESQRFFEYPQYETMVRASRDILRRAPVVRDIRVTFEVHPTMDRTFVYTILGGRIDPSALYTAVINADGSVTLQ